jgi:hypothetical protein
VSQSTSAIELPNLIQELLEQRQLHANSISQIDQTLARVTAALGGTATAVAVSKPAGKPAAVKAPVVKAKSGKRSQFTVSTGDLVLAFVKANANSTTQKIMQHLASEGRTASSGGNALSVLTAAKKLKRTPLGKGIPGSTYSIA